MALAPRIPMIAWGAGFTNQIRLLADSYLSFPVPRGGSQFGETTAGEEDSFVTGVSQYLSMIVRWLPHWTPLATLPYALTGWDDPTGWNAFLQWAWQKNTFRWYPDGDCVFVSQTVGDVAWSNLNSATRTAAAIYVNGVPLDLVGDSSATVYEGFYIAVPVTAAPGPITMSCIVQQSTATNYCDVSLWDVTAGAYVLFSKIDFTNATPNVTFSASQGTLISLTPFGTAWQIVMQTGTLTAGHTYRVYAYPAANGVAETGQMYVGAIQVWNDGQVRPPLYPGTTTLYQPCVLEIPAVLSDLQNLAMEPDGTWQLPVTIRSTDDSPFVGYA